MKYRIEKDTMGEVKVPHDALWGAQTQRALENFTISGIKFAFPFGRSFIEALGVIKHAAATSNQKLKLLDGRKAKAIKMASKEVFSGIHDSEFPLDVFQTGSGTSTNMNANEVIANLATKKARIKINANDHVNMSQSSNDVIPTAICISALLDTQRLLLPSLDSLITVIDKKALSLKGQVKTGRTHLMDAMPIDFFQELSGWSAQLKAVKKLIISASKEMAQLPQGGTAIGTGINAHKDFGKVFASEVSKLTKLNVKTSSNYFKSLSAQDSAAQLSSSVKNLSLVLTKISNDLRWMNSGPLTGLGEIELEALQPGSSIMPGKVNPTQCEAITMVATQVMGNHTTITIAGSNGHFELNVFKPVMIFNLLQSIKLITDSSISFTDNCVVGIKANTENINQLMQRSLMLVTALNPHIGYDNSTKIAKNAHIKGISLKDSALELGLLSSEDFDKWVVPQNMIGPKDQ